MGALAGEDDEFKSVFFRCSFHVVLSGGPEDLPLHRLRFSRLFYDVFWV
jgi:hypothetical protein